MSTEITAASAAHGSLGAIGAATQAFVMANPIALTFAGGLLLGAGAYWGVQRLMKKDDAVEQEPEATPTPA